MYVVLYVVVLILSITIRTRVLLKRENYRHQCEMEKGVKNKTKILSGLLIISFTNGKRMEEEIKYDTAYKFISHICKEKSGRLVKIQLLNNEFRVINIRDIQMISLIPIR